MEDCDFKGCLPPKIDLRDYKLAKTGEVILPTSFELSHTKIKNQGNVSSCVAHATSSILEYYAHPDYKLSTNFIYGIQNKECGHDGKGMYLRDACAIAKKLGDPEEYYCKGNDEVPKVWKIAEKVIEDDVAMTDAFLFRIESYVSLKSVEEIKQFIFDYGPVLASIKWYNNFKPDKHGILTGNQDGDYGYHAIMIYGWNEEGFLCQNSWGTLWGNKGTFILPYSIEVREAFGLVDDPTQGNVIKPKRNFILDLVYKVLNYLINLLHKHFI